MGKPLLWPSLGSTLLPVLLFPAQTSSLLGLGQPLHCLAEWPGLGHSTSLCLSFPTPLESSRAWKGGRFDRGQYLFQGEFSDLETPHASRGGETFFIQHCRGQALVSHLLRSAPRRGPEGVLCCFLGPWGWPLHGDRWGLDQSIWPPSLRGEAEAQGLLCLYVAQKLVWVL